MHCQESTGRPRSRAADIQTFEQDPIDLWQTSERGLRRPWFIADFRQRGRHAGCWQRGALCEGGIEKKCLRNGFTRGFPPHVSPSFLVQQDFGKIISNIDQSAQEFLFYIEPIRCKFFTLVKLEILKSGLLIVWNIIFDFGSVGVFYEATRKRWFLEFFARKIKFLKSNINRANHET